MYWTTLLGRQKRAAEHLSSTLSLCSRFLINIPDEDKDDAMRVCGHLELAHWFYLDFLRQDNMSLPACNLKEFMNTSMCTVCVSPAILSVSLQCSTIAHQSYRTTMI